MHRMCLQWQERPKDPHLMSPRIQMQLHEALSTMMRSIHEREKQWRMRAPAQERAQAQSWMLALLVLS